jgi:DNA-binding MarR family transcriptional regulator
MEHGGLSTGLADGGTRSRQLDEIAEALPERTSALSRLFLTRTSICVSRTEVGVLRLLSSGPRRITEIASIERVTQPAITLLVNRLAERGWVQRVADPSDGRAVLVSLTSEGAEAFAQLRAEYRAMLHAEMAMLPDEDVDTLARSVEILDELIERLTERDA